MRRTNEIPLKEAIERLLNAYKLKPKLQEAQVVQAWEKIVGPVIEKRTRDVYIKNRKLYIKLDSAPLRQELGYVKSKIIENVNAELGENVIDEVVLL